jgi:hypothetical protein
MQTYTTFGRTLNYRSAGRTWKFYQILGWHDILAGLGSFTESSAGTTSGSLLAGHGSFTKSSADTTFWQSAGRTWQFYQILGWHDILAVCWQDMEVLPNPRLPRHSGSLLVGH